MSDHLCDLEILCVIIAPLCAAIQHLIHRCSIDIFEDGSDNHYWQMNLQEIVERTNQQANIALEIDKGQ